MPQHTVAVDVTAHPSTAVPTPYRNLPNLPPPLSRLRSLATTPVPSEGVPAISPKSAPAVARSAAGTPASLAPLVASPHAVMQPFGSPASVADELVPPQSAAPSSAPTPAGMAAVPTLAPDNEFPGFRPPVPASTAKPRLSPGSAIGACSRLASTGAQVATPGPSPVRRSPLGTKPTPPLHASTPFQLAPAPPPLAMLQDLSYTGPRPEQHTAALSAHPSPIPLGGMAGAVAQSPPLSQAESGAVSAPPGATPGPKPAAAAAAVPSPQPRISPRKVPAGGSSQETPPSFSSALRQVCRSLGSD